MLKYFNPLTVALVLVVTVGLTGLVGLEVGFVVGVLASLGLCSIAAFELLFSVEKI